MKCPQCGNEDTCLFMIERSPEGETECLECNRRGKHEVFQQKVVEITKNQPHMNAHAMCVATRFDGVQQVTCFKRWIATFPCGTNITKLECPECGKQDSFVSFLPIDLAN